MVNIVTIETKLSQQEVTEQIKTFTGNLDFVITAPFSGAVDNDKFRMNRNHFIVHPFVPVADGKVKSIEGGSIIELSFVFPWLGHVAMIALIVMYISMPLPLSWGVIAAIIFAWIIFTLRHMYERKEFVKILKEKLSRESSPTPMP